MSTMDVSRTASARAARAVPGRIAWLRKISTVPAIAVVLLLSRTLNLCATTLFAYATLLASSPTIGFFARARTPSEPAVIVQSPLDTTSMWHPD